MKKTSKTFFLIAISMIVLHACTTTSKVAKKNTDSVQAPSAADLQRGKQQYSDLTSDALQQGYDTFTTKCGKCHRLKVPKNFTVDKWNTIFPKMAVKAKLSDQEKQNTLRYIMTMQSQK
ncbi:MAG TPA: hypothetical protein VNG53_08155 [Bacteroidia bacterium]|nr:hypothetical protein [Bacteroidia bacterium]